ncbi:MAG: hypothetical protein KatS3mg085_581 [Candidatus Dojkabacteria bacterium]|nr:MAG: hypothetical protein KatS3mg085_581 [Candidatus Dojkabacteria bacterium]
MLFENNFIIFILIVSVVTLFIFAILFNKNEKKTLPTKYNIAFKKFREKDNEGALINAFIALETILKNEFGKNYTSFELINKISDKKLKSKLHNFRIARNKLIHENRNVSGGEVESYLKTLSEIAKKFGYKSK